MEFKYLAINGDNVGDGIGNAIATDNHEELTKITGGLNEAHGGIDEWVESIGGEILTSSGDEGIYKVPSQAMESANLDEIRQRYSESAGTTITIGVGASMSEASKALIYGKMNEKDQVVEYDPSIDDFIASHGEDESEVGIEPELPEEGMEEEGQFPEEGMESELPEEGMEEELMPEGQMPEEGMEDPSMEEMHEEGMEGSFDETLMQEGEESQEELSKNPEEKISEAVGQDLDGDGDLDIMQAQDDPLNNAEGEEEMREEPQGNMDNFGEEMPEEGEDRQGAIGDMIHANMEGEEQGEDPEGLKNEIMQALMIFKENKDMLEASQQQNPELYSGIMSMLSSMIEMAKQLNMNPVGDMANGEVQGELPQSEGMQEEMPEEGMEGMEEELEEEVDPDVIDEGELAEDDEEQKDFKNQFKKNEIDTLYKNLFKSISKVKNAVKSLNKTSKFDSKLSAEGKKGRRKLGGKMAKPKFGESGVHRPTSTSGESNMGYTARQGTKMMRDTDNIKTKVKDALLPQHHPEKSLRATGKRKLDGEYGAKASSKRTLGESKKIKPDLPKGEKDVVKVKKGSGKK